MLETLAQQLLNQGLTLATAESCTGGGIAAYCTDLSGSSAWFNGGVVCYSNELKIQLGVQPQAIARSGAVSEQVVRQMAECGREYCQADWCIAVTGIAGPSGGSAAKPVGTVWLAWAGPQSVTAERCHFTGDRTAVRNQTVDYALSQLLERLK